MKKIVVTALALWLLSITTTLAQTKKIRVYLLGTFHFNQVDPGGYDVKSAAQQRSMQQLAALITKRKPDKVFVERMPDYEHVNHIDSLYQAYRQGKLDRARNEIWQVGGRVAAALQHPHLYQCDHPGQYGTWYRKIADYAATHGQQQGLAMRGKGMTTPAQSSLNEDSLRQATTLLEYMRWLNSPAVQGTSLAHYLNVFPQLGNTDVFRYDSTYFLGAELTADWYRRNLFIYAKMLAQLDYSEKAIFLLMGNDHIPVIRQLFEANPYFDVVDPRKWLGKTHLKVR
ncbi:DUF5694 domain-containing protein [Hymenobacter fodinae]|uniref:Uncharacterized protein n=1 Tax=Hymenobacter fodinae TaxID=2510796 RepID=A0A4Z0P010_9BACT|nr:DUF5694 domain-containing protein [Hymenobacter fodinae]TGE03723.1 hypothetical protein EU556_24220 [Hymenobacter fodinae]